VGPTKKIIKKPTQCSLKKPAIGALSFVMRNMDPEAKA
jgi:hypothetical protein